TSTAVAPAAPARPTPSVGLPGADTGRALEIAGSAVDLFLGSRPVVDGVPRPGVNTGSATGG
ncbi:hypothetical protein ACFV6F_37990, partial [Kitasatospora phosalacinea]|uniref:hypothetical protein n=1 Tax=Kitasatospora phosalacinea TaxID=2065 RepID=UPI003663444F